MFSHLALKEQRNVSLEQSSGSSSGSSSSLFHKACIWQCKSLSLDMMLSRISNMSRGFVHLLTILYARNASTWKTCRCKICEFHDMKSVKHSEIQHDDNDALKTLGSQVKRVTIDVKRDVDHIWKDFHSFYDRNVIGFQQKRKKGMLVTAHE